MTYTYKTVGTCSRSIEFDIVDGKVKLRAGGFEIITLYRFSAVSQATPEVVM